MSYAPPSALPPGSIICPNPNCGYRGPPTTTATGGSSGCLLLILLCLGIVPGILYLLLAGRAQYIGSCPQCRVTVGPVPAPPASRGQGITLLVLLVILGVVYAVTTSDHSRPPDVAPASVRAASAPPATAPAELAPPPAAEPAPAPRHHHRH